MDGLIFGVHENRKCMCPKDDKDHYREITLFHSSKEDSIFILKGKRCLHIRSKGLPRVQVDNTTQVCKDT